ncbi:MAG: class I SAM-dependent methyltransferase, partial [Bacteroidetes bacterium]|nr:class I SAM-dependent methyltransferase [Bacteroidota bacterium]
MKNNITMTHDKCLVCDSINIAPLKGYYEVHELVKCSSCGFVFMEKIPTSEELISYYATYSYSGEDYLSPITIKSYQTLLDEFEPYRKSNKILDVGCGRGWFLLEAKKRGWEVYGTEYSSAAMEICNNEGFNMHGGELDPSNYKDHDFDVITSFEVIEHINTPTKDLSAINKLLRQGGLFYLTTPNFNSLLRYYLKSDFNIICYPEHLSYYTKSTLNKAVLQHGFIASEFKSTGISFTRILTSKRIKEEKIISEESTDEVLRRNIET